MNKIFKYRLHLLPRQKIKIPRDALYLHIDTVEDDIYVWALVDTKASIEDVVIRMFATGEEIPDLDHLAFIGTVLHFDGKYVWHFFKEI